MKKIEESLDKLREKIQNEDFLNGRGQSNEVGIWFFCYDPEHEMAVRHFVSQLATDQALNCNLKIKDLYDIFLESCEDMDILDAIPDMEAEDGGEFLLDQLHSAIGAGQFIEKIKYSGHERGRDVLMLTGVGKVFPFMRVHALLEALQPYFTDIPILVMYPGEFDCHQLKLFNRLKPHDYYRAFNVL